MRLARKGFLYSGFLVLFLNRWRIYVGWNLTWRSLVFLFSLMSKHPHHPHKQGHLLQSQTTQYRLDGTCEPDRNNGKNHCFPFHDCVVAKWKATLEDKWKWKAPWSYNIILKKKAQPILNDTILKCIRQTRAGYEIRPYVSPQMGLQSTWLKADWFKRALQYIIWSILLLFWIELSHGIERNHLTSTFTLSHRGGHDSIKTHQAHRSHTPSKSSLQNYCWCYVVFKS